MKISGHGVIVTGGGSGLGAATAETLAAQGAKVTIVDLNAEAAKAVATRIGGLALPGDVTDEAAMVAVFESARQSHGPCRVLALVRDLAEHDRQLEPVGRDGLDEGRVHLGGEDGLDAVLVLDADRAQVRRRLGRGCIR